MTKYYNHLACLRKFPSSQIKGEEFEENHSTDIPWVEGSLSWGCAFGACQNNMWFVFSLTRPACAMAADFGEGASGHPGTAGMAPQLFGAVSRSVYLGSILLVFPNHSASPLQSGQKTCCKRSWVSGVCGWIPIRKDLGRSPGEMRCLVFREVETSETLPWSAQQPEHLP